MRSSARSFTTIWAPFAFNSSALFFRATPITSPNPPSTPAWTPDDSNRLLATRFCILDHAMVDLFWTKYDVFRERRYVLYDTAEPHHAFMAFRDWLVLHDRYQA